MASKWISFDELLARWGIRDFEILDYLNQGLPIYNSFFQKITEVRPDKAGYDYSLREEPYRIEFPFMNFEMPEDTQMALRKLSNLESCFFKREEVSNFERERGLVPQDQPAHPTSSAIQSPHDDKVKVVDITESTGPLAQDRVRGDNYFIREGNGWQIGFGGEKGFFSDRAYIRCIVMLLNKPGEAIPCIELYNLIKGKPAGKEFITDNQKGSSAEKELMIYTRIKEEGLNISPRTEKPVAIMDFKAKKQIETRLKELLNEREKIESKSGPREPDSELELREIEKEIAGIQKELWEHKHFNAFEANTKKVQSNIRKHLTTAYTTLRKTQMKRLSKHLTEKIRPAGGYDYRYIDTDTHWEIIW